jgi:hypothetical protein
MFIASSENFFESPQKKTLRLDFILDCGSQRQKQIQKKEHRQDCLCYRSGWVCQS